MKVVFKESKDFAELTNKTLVILITEDFYKEEKNKYTEGSYAFEEIIEDKDFSGKFGQIFSAIEKKNKYYDRVIFVGLGKEEKIDNLKFEEIGQKLLKYLDKKGFKKISIAVNTSLTAKKIATNNIKKNDINDLVGHLAFGINITGYKFNKYFTGEKLKNQSLKLEEIEIICADVKLAESKYKEMSILEENILFCRDLVNEPSNILTPKAFAEICLKLKSIGLDVQVMDEKEIEKLGMNSLLAVGQGSELESQFVVLKYNGSKDKNSKPLAFVGKGVTFDSGGLSLKPENAMIDMKCDMSGAAVVVSLLRLLAERKAKVNAIGCIALVENMPSGSAQRPGDVVKSMSGQTIEVLNTDAEGRMILADALYYAATKFNPELIIDLATLTGAIVVALGEKYAGLFSNNDSLVKELEASAKHSGELVWRMPLSEIGGYFDKMIDSDIADMKNLGVKGQVGATTAAQFLQRFINKHSKWAHIDIAGTAYVERPNYFVNRNATGYGVRLLNQLIKDNYEDKNK